MKLIRFNHENFQDDMGVSIETPNIIIKKENKKNKLYWLLSILIILMITVLIFVNNFYINNGKDIFYKHYNQEQFLTEIRGSNDFYDAFLAFYHKDYEKSSELFKKIYTYDNKNVTAKFYYGLSCIEQENNDEAIRIFDSIIKQNDNLYVQQSKWCVALSYVKMEKYDNATQKLREIAVDSNNFYHDKALDVLIDIEKIKIK